MARKPKSVRDPDLAAALRSGLERGFFAPAQASRVIRALDGRSQQEFAEQLGMSVKVIKAIESGNGNPSYDALTRIAGAAGLRVAFVSESRPVELMDPHARADEERLRRRADAEAIASGRVSAHEMHKRNALRIDELSFELRGLA
jgi:transcriptional regulator with XRE-family HTH domain